MPVRRRTGSIKLKLKKQPSRNKNKTEARFEQQLELRRRAGDILSHQFEAVKLRLARYDCWYTPDFFVVNADGSVTIYEVKGYWRDDARVKTRVAADQFPYFEFVGVTYSKGDWQYEHF